MAKKILFLGASQIQIPPLLYAREQGYYVITCDNIPGNPGHRYANESHNVSTTDKEAVLQLAIEHSIDGIVAYASDPAAPTASFVAEKLGLPGNPYSSVLTLTRKDLFRSFLKLHGFNVPRSQSFSLKCQALKWLNEIGIPAYIKPVDSSGSKGVTYLDDLTKFDAAFNHALAYSREGLVIIEEPIHRFRYQVAGDGFVVDGKLIFRCWADEHFDKLCNGLVPIGQTFPTSHRQDWLQVAHMESQRLISLLGLKTGALNFDYVFTEDGKFYFLELGPRNGGCLIPDVIRYATGVDLIKYTVDASIGLNCKDIKMNPVSGYWSSYMVHSLETGQFKDIWMSKRISSKIIEKNIWVKTGEHVEKYIGSNHTLGTLILKFESMEEMLEIVDNMENDIRVLLY